MPEPRTLVGIGVGLSLLASPLPFDPGVAEGAGVLAYGWVGVAPSAALAIGLIGRLVGQMSWC